jgi:hypothetical protein
MITCFEAFFYGKDHQVKTTHFPMEMAITAGLQRQITRLTVLKRLFSGK